MNREIKFRAYDTKLKKYVDQGEVTFSFYGDTKLEVFPNEINYGWVSDYEHNVLNGRFIVEQYTGLKDANGVEIYEGDILSKRWRVTVYWSPKASAFVVRFGEAPIINKPCTLAKYIARRKRAGTAYADCEIIGNIHDNPDLNA